MDKIFYDNECCQTKNIKSYRKIVSIAAKFYLALVLVLVEAMLQLTSVRGKVFELEALQRCRIIMFLNRLIHEWNWIFCATKGRCHHQNHVAWWYWQHYEWSITAGAHRQVKSRFLFFFRAHQLIKRNDFITPFRTRSVNKNSFIELLFLWFCCWHVVTLCRVRAIVRIVCNWKGNNIVNKRMKM